MREAAWLVELDGAYSTGPKHFEPPWTRDHLQAFRFPDVVEATRWRDAYAHAASVVEHVWLDASEAGQQALTDAQRELLEDKYVLWERESRQGPTELRDYNRRAAEALKAVLCIASGTHDGASQKGNPHE